nr:penicillin-binding transpeptidase domain-containing protein [Sphingomonas colocasiae]
MNIDGVGSSGIQSVLGSPRVPLTPRVATSLDIRVQRVLEAELLATIQAHGARSGQGLVIDARSGEVLAMATLPGFDPNDMATYRPDLGRNAPIQDLVQFGNLWGPVTTAAALDAGTASPAQDYDIRSPMTIGEFVIRDAFPTNGSRNLAEIALLGSNVGGMRIAETMRMDDYRAAIARFGLAERPTIELPGAASPLVPRTWSRPTLASVVTGYGYAGSLLQMTNTYRGLIMGMAASPTVMKQATGSRPEGPRMLRDGTAQTMRRLFRVNVTDGPGRKADIRGLALGGFGGSVEPLTRIDGGRPAISSFIGAFPMYAPRYLIAVAITDPKGNAASFGYATSAWVAAPLVGRVAARSAPLLGVVPDESNDVDISGIRPLLRIR